MQPPDAGDSVDFSEIFSMERIAYNGRNLNFCRVFVAIVSGMASGILGLTGLVGFVAFFAMTLLLSVGLYLTVGCDPKPYFRTPADIWFGGISEAAMSYILFWTLFYDVSPMLADGPVQMARGEDTSHPPPLVPLLADRTHLLAFSWRCLPRWAAEKLAMRYMLVLQ